MEHDNGSIEVALVCVCECTYNDVKSRIDCGYRGHRSRRTQCLRCELSIEHDHPVQHHGLHQLKRNAVKHCTFSSLQLHQFATWNWNAAARSVVIGGDVSVEIMNFCSISRDYVCNVHSMMVFFAPLYRNVYRLISRINVNLCTKQTQHCADISSHHWCV